MRKISAARQGAAYCYILGCADGSYYTGWTNNLPRRIREHAAGRGGRYTRSRCPVTLLYFEEQADAGAARRREAAIKQLPRMKKTELIEGKKRAGPAKEKRNARKRP
jgi:putative endonuclease